MNSIKLHIFQILATALTLLPLCANAQTANQKKSGQGKVYKITGQVITLEDYTPLPGVSVYLLNTDSTQIGAMATSENGEYSFIVENKKKDYILKATSLGYLTRYRTVHVLGRNTVAEPLRMEEDMKLLDNVEVTGNLPKVQAVEDTLIFNADAYRMPEGSVLEELIERLPGAEVEDGKISINGRQVKKILLDGKEFFVGDMETALKNVPTSIIDKLKHFNEKSDMSKVTGIDDGEENPVLDVRIKKGMNKGYNVNADLAYGTHDRYAERLNANMFQQNMKLSLVGNANNANDRSTPGRGGRGGSNGTGGGSNGLRATKNVGVNMNFDNKKKLQMDGNVQWRHGDTDATSRSSSESFVSRTGAFSNSASKSLGRTNAWNSEWRIEWKPTEEWNIQLRPTASINTSDRLQSSNNASFNADPYQYVDNPLDPEANFGEADTIRVNTRSNSSINYSRSRNLGASLMINRKFGSNGRNLTLRADGTYSDTDGNSLSNNLTHYHKLKNTLGQDSLRYTNRYNENFSKSNGYSMQLTYSEPIFPATFLQFSYRFQYRFNDNNRNTYDFMGLNELFGQGVTPEYRGWEQYLCNLQNGYETFLDDSLSSYSDQKNLVHDFNLTLRIVRTKYNLSIGGRYTPQIQKFHRNYLRREIDEKRTTYNISPTLTFRYRFSRQHTLNIDYHGNTQQPSITQLLDVKDDSNPLNISIGNPRLKPSYTSNLQMRYNRYISERRQSIAINGNFSTTSNSISNMVTYDEQTGGRTTKPENINGNWNASGNLLLTSAIDKAANWNVSSSSDIRYNHYVSYVNLNRSAESEKNTTKTTTMSERLSGSYRNTWLEVELNTRVNYTCGRNVLQSSANRDTWQYSYGCSFNVKLPWNMTLDTSVNQMSRRGYSDKTFNTNEFIWNGQITQQILPRRRLVATLQFYDILGQQSNYSRNISANSRSDSWHNSVNSYAMLHIVYQFRNFGGRNGRMGNSMRQNRGEDGERPDFNRSEFQGGGNRGGGFGGNGGGFGGNRGGGNGGGRF